MKYSIKDKILYNIGYLGIEVANRQPTDAEREFWTRIQELEKLCAEKEERINQLVFTVASSLEKLRSK